MDEKIKTWPLRFPAKETLIWRRHCSIGQSCCSMTSKKFLESSSGMKFVYPRVRLANQNPGEFVSVSYTNQIALFPFVCCFCFVRAFSRKSLYFTQFGGGHHCFNFDKFHDTAPLQKKKKKKRKRERKKKPCLTCFFSSFSSMIDGSSCFSGSATGTSAVSDFSLLRLFLFSFFLSFSCFSFLSDLSLRCLRLDSLDSVF